MSQSSPFFNRWLSQIGPDQVVAVLTDLVDAGAVFAVDSEGKVLFWSKGAEKLFNLSAESVLGQGCAQALGCTDRDPCGLAEQGEI
ncbi:MAG: PAS domain-containing protein, partial [Methylococcaceae bacterium]|nr:PAS domain-containing protein [Methylococcaceae bacterium]